MLMIAVRVRHLIKTTTITTSTAATTSRNTHAQTTHPANHDNAAIAGRYWGVIRLRRVLQRTLVMTNCNRDDRTMTSNQQTRYTANHITENGTDDTYHVHHHTTYYAYHMQ